MTDPSQCFACLSYTTSGDAASAWTAVTAMAALLAILGSIWVARVGRIWAKRDREIDHRLRQLTELYGPLYVQRVVGRKLWQLLNDGKEREGGWRLVDNISAIKAEADDSWRRNLVGQILLLNEQSVEVITRGAALFDTFPPPRCYVAFVEHALVLDHLWRLGVDRGEHPVEPYPEEINEVLSEDVRRLQTEMDGLRASPGYREVLGFRRSRARAR